ncbi:neutrophil cytosol factor 1 isoform X3 [Entelurus aequoreus]|uniref:neutrophil cytosol factor 1 isoform X3 n=1 Tax=Entelurus aequoreus TaxID=161455 RepID=UPI002B1D5D92|nr:neutrophil cytosol factor 1 isoform X3 [Entelurus aequoreus]
MEELYVRHVKLLGFEKRFYPSQHYVYMLMVKWSDLSEKLIYRTYPEIHTFHKSLKEMFPIESGQIEKKDRIIPSLPAPRWVESQRSRENKQSTLAEYCQSLVNLPPHISRCAHLNVFFKVRREDENPSTPNTVKKSETFVENKVNISGWWFCQCDIKRGWAPASYLEPLDGPEETEDVEPNYEGELHVTIRAYKKETEDEISLDKGVTIEVIHKLLDGWWVVRKGEETGHFPSMFLQKAGKDANYESEQLQGQKPPPRRSTIKNAKSIHNRARQRLSQETYRRNSRRYLQQKGQRPTAVPRKSKNIEKSPLKERRNQGNIPEQLSISSESELKQEAPVIPPRPSPELILERCTDNTRKRVSLRNSGSSSSSSI